MKITEMRMGIGYDVHRLTSGRRLVLGGVAIPFAKGLLGHSDADVLLHAIADALLGAAGLGDIGMHFPDTDPAFEGADSMDLLRRTQRLTAQAGFSVVNVDATVMAQAPRLGPHREQMAENVSAALQIPRESVNVKFTTTEGLGFIGAGEGIAAMAAVAIRAV